MPLIDLVSLASDEREAEIQHLITQEFRQLFDLSHDMLLRVALIRASRDSYVTMLVMHHIITDGWSMSVFMRELATLYAAFSTGQPSPLPELPIQYADFAVWQRQRLQGRVLDAQLNYWIKQLSGVTPLALPTDHVRPAIQSYCGASYTFTLPASLSQALVALSAQEGVTLFMTLLAAFQTLLYHYTKQTDIVVGTDFANRTHVETESLIGFFINLLALRTDLSGSPTFREVLRSVHKTVLDAYTHQDTPFEMIIEKLHLHNTVDRMPLVQALLVLQNLPPAGKGLQGLTHTPIGGQVATAKFDIALFMQKSSAGLHGSVVYSTDLFEITTIATMMKRFEVLLQKLVDNPTVPIDVIAIQTEDEKESKKKEKSTLRKALRAGKGERIDLSDTSLPDGPQFRKN